jgi:xanthine dehydrogenase accessory factor
MVREDYRPVDVHRKVAELARGRAGFALAVILSADGSTPQKAGVKAVIDAAGKIWGTLGGGAVEAQSQRRAVDSCRSGRPIVFDFSLLGASAADCGPVCGGSMRLLVDPTVAQHAENVQAYGQAIEAARRRQRGVLLTTLCTSLGAEASSRTDVRVQWLGENAAAGHSDFPGSQAITACLAGEVPRLFADSPAPQEAIEVFVEPVIPPPLLLIAGGGHVGQAVALQASQLGFDVTVIDDRPEFTNAALFPSSVNTRCGKFAEQLAAVPLEKDTYIVIVTRGHQHDAEALAACIHAPVGYIGMIGSRRKVALMRAHFLDSGLATEEEFNRVFAPVGLDIGAVTVPEIAVSIAAQLIAVRRGTLETRKP